MATASLSKAASDFLLSGLPQTGETTALFLTLRPHQGGVNETANACEQAVIPVADTLPKANK